MAAYKPRGNDPAKRRGATVEPVMASGSRVARGCVMGAVVLSLASVVSCGGGSTQTTPATRTAAKNTPTPTAPAVPVVPAGDFTSVVRLVTDAIAAHRMPGGPARFR